MCTYVCGSVSVYSECNLETLSQLLGTRLLHNAMVPVAIRMEFSGCERFPRAALVLSGSTCTIYSTCAHNHTCMYIHVVRYTHALRKYRTLGTYQMCVYRLLNVAR